jgi:integrase
MATMNKRQDTGAMEVTVQVNGKRVRASVGSMDAKQGQAVADATQALVDGMEGATVEKLKRLCGAIFDAAGVVPFWETQQSSLTVAQYLHRWLAEKKPSLSRERLMALAGTFDSVCSQKGLGTMQLSLLTTSALRGWFESLPNSASTRNQKAGWLAHALEDAVADRLLNANPARRLKAKDEDDSTERIALPDDEIRKLINWLQIAPIEHRREWVDAVRFARWTGLRLMDLMGLHADNFKEVEGTTILTVTMKKTGEQLVVPLHPQADLDIPDSGWLFPALRLRSKSQLSQTFGRYLERAGVANPTRETISGRKQSAYSFHSLRHSFITWLNAQGYDEATRMKLAGHKSARVHAGYNHVDPMAEAVKLAAKL